MLKNEEIILLLSSLTSLGVSQEEINKQIKKLYTSSLKKNEVIKFINDNKPLDIKNFYNKLRKSYNEKHSKLYVNIVKEIDNPEEVLTTLSSYILQVNLYTKNVDNTILFLQSSRVQEACNLLSNYYLDYNIQPLVNFIKSIKLDLKLFESL